MKAFTLTELLVVLGIIVLVMGIVLPSIIPLLASGTATQVRAVVSALLGAARGMAIERQSYALVHFQMGVDDNCWAAVLIYESIKDPITGEVTGHRFVPAEGFRPRKIPGGFALGEVTTMFLTPNGKHFQRLFDLPAGRLNPFFTTFSAIFAPDGSLADLVPDINGNLVWPHIDTTSILFDDAAQQRIWHSTVAGLDEPGVRVMVLFPYKDLMALPPGGALVRNSREEYLDENGKYFVINPHTGRLLPNE